VGRGSASGTGDT
jgi:predicted RNA-binding protein with EMAP domain